MYDSSCCDHIRYEFSNTVRYLQLNCFCFVFSDQIYSKLSFHSNCSILIHRSILNIAIFTYFVNKKKVKNALTPEDAYYSAPFCFMPKKDKRSGFVIFTCQVPWLSGNPKKSSDDNEIARPHEQAREWMAERGTLSDKAPHVGSVEFFQDELSLKEDEVYCFTKGMQAVLSIWLL